MESSPSTPRALAFGFGTAVSMWGFTYGARLPGLVLPAPGLLTLLGLCLIVGGWLAGRAGSGWPSGAAAGAIAATINLLVLGGLLSEAGRTDVPGAWLWVPGSLLLSAALGACGGLLAGRGAEATPDAPRWVAAFVRVAVVATLLLLGVGGLVTSAEAGLAVADWPRSFGYNMFLYPLSRMTGGIYFEHAHRLFGALVGLTTLVLAFLLQRHEERAWVRRLGWAALAMVVVQGLLGGLRVTGRLTLGTEAAEMAPSLTLATVHGVFAQVFFCTLVALAAFTSRGWREGEVESQPRAGAMVDRLLGVALLAVLLVQLVLGAVQRHQQALLIFHVVTGVALVAPLCVHAGVRAWALNPGRRLLQRLGLALVGSVVVQVLLGFAAYVTREGQLGRAAGLGIATAHQWFGAVLLALAVLHVCWTSRVLRPR